MGDRMQHLGLKPDLVTFNSVINARAKRGEFSGMDYSFNHMRSVCIEPDKVTFTSILGGCLRNNNLAKAKEWFIILSEYVEEGIIEHIVYEDSVFQNLFLDYLEKSQNPELLQLGKDQFVKINDGPKIKDGMIDCHGFSHGAATLQILVYLEQHVTESEIIILAGHGDKEKENLHAMRDYIIHTLQKYGWGESFEIKAKDAIICCRKI